MSDEATKAPRDRSPSFPIISLKAAVERLEKFESTFGRHPSPYKKAGMAWGIKEGSSQANQVLAALKAYGFLKYEGSGNDRVAAISEMGRTYLRAQQDRIKQDVLRKAALMPKQFAKFWPEWKTDRPLDAICLDALVLEHGFNDNAAPTFLRVYDETMAFAGLVDSDKVGPADEETPEFADNGAGEGQGLGEMGGGAPPPPPSPPPTPPPPPPPGGQREKIKPMENERVLASGPLSKNASFRLFVEGPISVKEIDHLIAKLQLDKAIYADEDETEH